MSSEKVPAKPMPKNASKSVSLDGESKYLREGVKPSAPANFKLPEPVKIPPAVASNSGKNAEKKSGSKYYKAY